MAPPPTTSLVSQHSSTSGLQISLHPLALLTISDYITRHTLREIPGAIVGAILGHQDGREIAIEYAYEVLLTPSSTPENIEIDTEWFTAKLSLFKETHPTADLLGWFTTTSSPQFHPLPQHVAFHQHVLGYNESAILLLMNPSHAAAVAGGGKLPIAIYESILEADDAEKKMGLKFVPLNYTIEAGEAEMIGMDFVAKGAGNATDVPGGTEKAAKQKAAEGGKGKEKAEEEKKEETVDIGLQNDELLSNLTAKKNAILMLSARIKLLLEYLKNPPDGVTNHQILREIKALTHSRLPLLTPANTHAFRQEKLAEESDVNLVVLLGAVTHCIEGVRDVSRKSAGIDLLHRGNKKPGQNVFDSVDGMEFGVMMGGGGGAPRERRQGRSFGGNRDFYLDN